MVSGIEYEYLLIVKPFFMMCVMKPKNHVPGWQTMAEAAIRHGVTKQRIHQIVVARQLPTKPMFGYKLVAYPFPFRNVK